MLTTRFQGRVKVTRRENGDCPGIADGLVKRGEELVIIRGKEGKRDRVNQCMCFVRGGLEDLPRGVAHSERFG